MEVSCDLGTIPFFGKLFHVVKCDATILELFLSFFSTLLQL